jgi:hypothetical protein
MRTALFWAITQRVVVISYLRLGPIFSGPRSLKMGPIGCPETAVRNYHYSLRNDPEERSSLGKVDSCFYEQCVMFCSFIMCTRTAVTEDYWQYLFCARDGGPVLASVTIWIWSKFGERNSAKIKRNTGVLLSP